jgi:hypothetical protein
VVNSPDWVRSCEDCQRFAFSSDGQIAMCDVRGSDGQIKKVPQERPPGWKPPCAVCPKWDGIDEDPRPLDGDEDLFGLAWPHELWDQFHEGRLFGWTKDVSGFCRRMLVEMNRAYEKIQQQRLTNSMSSAFRRISRWG